MRRKRRASLSLFFLLFSSPWRAHCMALSGKKFHIFIFALPWDYCTTIKRNWFGWRRDGDGRVWENINRHLLNSHCCIFPSTTHSQSSSSLCRSFGNETWRETKMRTRCAPILSPLSCVRDVVNNIKFMFRNMKLHVGQHENESMLTWRSRCCVDRTRRWTKLNSKSFFRFVNFTRQMRIAFYSILNQ